MLSCVPASLVFIMSVQFKRHASTLADLTATVIHRQNHRINPRINDIAKQSLDSVITTHNLINVYDCIWKLY